MNHQPPGKSRRLSQYLRMDFGAARRITPRVLLPLLDRAQRSTEGRRLARGVFWSAAGAVSSRAVALLASFVVARVLGRTVFGELGIIQSTLNMFATFAELGLGLTATRFVAEFRRKEPARAGRIVAMASLAAVASGTAIAILMVVTSAWAAHVLAAPHLRVAIAVSALALLLMVINDAQHGTLSGLEAFKRLSAVQIAAAIASFPITVLGALYFGLMGAVYGLIASQAVVALWNYRAVRFELASAGVPVRWKEARREAHVLLSFSLPTLCAGAVYVPSMWIANMLMVNTPSGYDQMGIFSAADRWRTAILFLPALLGGVALPMLSSLRGEGASRKYHAVLTTNLGLSVLAAIAVAIPVALLAPWIMAGYGPGFAEGRWVLVTLCATSVASAGYRIVLQSLLSRGHVWTMFSLNLGWATVLLSTEWFLRGRGAAGLALAYLSADATRLVAALFYAYRSQQRES